MVGAGAPILTRSRGGAGAGRKRGAGRLIVGVLLAAVVLLIILAATGLL